MRIILMILLLSSPILAANPIDIQSTKKRLFLVGGSLKTCSSMSLNNCKNPDKNDISGQIAPVKSGALYNISTPKNQQFERFWPENFSLKNRKKLVKLLTKAAKKAPEKSLSKGQLKKLLKQFDKNNLINRLSDPEYYYLLDSLEIPQTNQATRHKEKVNLHQSKNPFTVELFEKFVALAAQTNTQTSTKNKPNILVVTASARDPFEAVDFYLQAFTQAGANTQWLPIDAALQATWQENNHCKNLIKNRLNIQGNAFREHIYPDLTEQQAHACQNPQVLAEQIAKADGIFINGGDQSLTVAAFKDKSGNDYPIMTQIRAKFDAGQLIIGGTSAGTAVMSAPAMITNGRSEVAINRGAKADVLPVEGCSKSSSCKDGVLQDDLTYRSQGGLQLFPFGILDTHFSERGRQGRLAQLIKDTNTPFGFGVDETTALLVSWHESQTPQFEVLGQSGVFVVENRNNKQFTHYITRDDKAVLTNNTLNIKFASWKKPSVEQANLDKQYPDFFHKDRYKLLSELLCRTSNQQLNASSSWEDNQTKVTISKSEQAISRFGAIQTKSSGNYHYCSYQNYQLNF